MKTPDLFLIGTQKGGSSSLFACLKQHPNIVTLGKKEPNIFCSNTEEEARARLSKFSFKKSKFQFCLDASVNYTRYPKFSESAYNIYKICGEADVKFIYILRNPVERLISNYFWNAYHYGESRTLESAIEIEQQYIKTSLYDYQIQQYLQYFDLRQFYFLSFDDFIKDPIRETNKIFEWLELSAMTDITKPKKRAATKKDITRTARIPILNDVIWSYYPIRTTINLIFPQKVVKQVSRLMSKTTERPKISVFTKKELLQKYFTQSIQNTSKLTSLNLQHWLDVYEP